MKKFVKKSANKFTNKFAKKFAKHISKHFSQNNIVQKNIIKKTNITRLSTQIAIKKSTNNNKHLNNLTFFFALTLREKLLKIVNISKKKYRKKIIISKTQKQNVFYV